MIILIHIIHHNTGFIYAVILIAWIYWEDRHIERKYETDDSHYSNLSQKVLKRGCDWVNGGENEEIRPYTDDFSPGKLAAGFWFRRINGFCFTGLQLRLRHSMVGEGTWQPLIPLLLISKWRFQPVVGIFRVFPHIPAGSRVREKMRPGFRGVFHFDRSTQAPRLREAWRNEKWRACSAYLFFCNSD